MGYGVGSAVLIGREDTPGEQSESLVTIPFTSEDVKGNRAMNPTATITGRRALTRRNKGKQTAAGSLSQEVDGASFGFLFNLLNGTASGALTSAALPGRVATISAADASGGDLPVGVYYVKAATVLERTLDGSLWVMPASAEPSSVTLASSNRQIDYSWTNPVAFPRGFTLAGTALYRTVAGGASGSEKLAFYLDGSGNSYSLDDATKFVSTCVPLVATGYQHTFVEAFTVPNNPLPAFSYVAKKDVPTSMLALGGRMNGLELAVSNGDEPATAKWDMMFRRATTISNPSHSLSDIPSMMSWQSVVGVDGSWEDTLESFTLSIKNGAENVPGLIGKPWNRDVGYGVRDIGIQANRGYEDNGFFDKMMAGDTFNFGAFCAGGPLAAAAAGFTTSFDSTNGGLEADVLPLPYMIQLEAYDLSLGEAGGNVGGFGRIIEGLNSGAQRNVSEGTDLRVTLFNLTSSYS